MSATSRDKVIDQIKDAMRVVGNMHADATNFINSERVIDGNQQVVTRDRINESLDESVRIVQEALRAAKHELESPEPKT